MCIHANITPTERQMRSHIKDASTPTDRGKYIHEISEHFRNNGLLYSRLYDSDLSISMIALWKALLVFGKAALSHNISVSNIIYRHTGHRPPAFFSSYFNREASELAKTQAIIEYTESECEIADGMIYYNGSALTSEDDATRIRSILHRFQTGYAVKMHAHKTHSIIIVYNKHLDTDNAVLCVCNKSKLVTWCNSLYACGICPMHAGKSVSEKKVHSIISEKYLYIYGSGMQGHVYIESYDISNGNRVSAFATNNYYYR